MVADGAGESHSSPGHSGADTGDAPAARDADTLWSRMVPPPPLHTTTTCTVHPVLWLATTAPWCQYTTTTRLLCCL